MATVEAEAAKARGRKGGVGDTSSNDQKRGVRLRPAERGRFLRSLAAGNTARKAAADAGRSYVTFYRHRAQDERFADAWTAAEKEGTQELEQVAIGRAKDQSDTLLMFLLKRRDPAYRDSHQVEINHSGTIEHEHKVVSASAVLHILQDAEGFDGFEAPGLAGHGGALPSTRELLAAHPDTEAGSVPPASAS